MPWVKIDDQFADHPKIMQAGPLAAWIYVCGLCYSARYLTDGFIPDGQVRKLADVDDVTPLVTRLVDVGLWDVSPGGYQIHDYLDYNPTGEQIKEERKASAKRQADYRERHRKPNGRFGSDNQSSNGVSNAVTNDATNDVVTTAPSPSPSPDTTQKPDPKGADAPTQTPSTFEQWRDGYRSAENQSGYAGFMLTTLYPGYYKGTVKPNYGMLAKMLKANDAEYVLSLFFQQSSRPPTGDPVRFIQGILNNKPSAGDGRPPAKPRVGSNYHEDTQEEADRANAAAAARLAAQEASHAKDQ